MNPATHDILLIEDFLDGKLVGKALADFQKRVDQDKRFAALVEARKKLAAANRETQDYQQLKQEIGSMIHAERKRVLGMKPLWAWSLAASVIILVGLVIVLQYTVPSPGQMAASDTTETLRMDEPKEYAVKDTVSIFIIAPVLEESFGIGDSLLLEWETNQEVKGELFITNATSGRVLLQKLVDVREGQYVLQPNLLPAGKYYWYIDDTVSKGSFLIRDH
jgi:hypothetical protein